MRSIPSTATRLVWTSWRAASCSIRWCAVNPRLRRQPWAVVLGLLILIAALFLVNNTVHLIVYNRRKELEVARLVGASNSFILLPFLIEGAVQGLFGVLSALAVLQVVQHVVIIRLQEALQLNVAGTLQPLPREDMVMLGLAGISLGMIAALFAVLRFLRRAP